MTEAQAARTIELLEAILAELRSWKEGPTTCPHPDDQQQNLSTMGCRHIRCRLCGVDLINEDPS